MIRIYKIATPNAFFLKTRSTLKTKLHKQINLSSLQDLERLLLNDTSSAIMSSLIKAPRLTDSAWLKKNGWESMHHFMASYQLKIEDDDDYEQGKLILAAIRAANEKEEAISNAERSTGFPNTSEQTQTNSAANHDAGNRSDAPGNQDGRQLSAGGSTSSSEVILDDKKPVKFMGTLRSYPSYGSGGSAKD
ncbi:hypothetical protein BCON_0056g00440 [Botryotinia convoluta]|uniref:Uncharacterized protein n=1 Tax=Botryotinia convoluta TaxID=54673 RepID=A0A4Z1IFF8_9HELO|nr:hypothetical protein BCON_0056g00440 [Botryotinia convoluta]